MERDYIEDSNYKKRKLAGLPANFVIGRIIYKNYQPQRFEKLGNAMRMSPLIRGMEVETRNNGITTTALPKRGNNSSLNITFEGDNPLLLEWYSKIENKQASYLCDCLVVIINEGTNTFIRVAGLRRTWISNLSSVEVDGKEGKQHWGETINLEHAGWKYIDIGDTITIETPIFSIDKKEILRYNTVEYKKDKDNFSSESDALGNKYGLTYLI